MKSFVARQGGKSRSKNKIIKAFPPKDAYNIYVEPFIGGGSVFLAQKTDEEVINDLDKDIYHIWRDIPQVSQSDVDKYNFRATKTKFDRLINENPTNPAERLYRNLYLSYNSFASLRKNLNPAPSKRNTFKKRFGDIKERLKDVIIENKDYKDIIKKYDSDKTLFYLDPPYYGTDNKSYSNKNIDFTELADLLAGIKGYAVMSINDDPDIRKLFKGFRIRKLPKVRYTVTNDAGIVERDELLIFNF